MPGPKFFETRMGHQFYDGTMRRIMLALETIAVELKKANAPPRRRRAKEATHDEVAVRAAARATADPD